VAVADGSELEIAKRAVSSVLPDVEDEDEDEHEDEDIADEPMIAGSSHDAEHIAEEREDSAADE
jgi:hypothetical protein